MKLLQRVRSLLRFQDADKVWGLLGLLLGRLLLAPQSELLLGVQSERVGRVLITRREERTRPSWLLIKEPATSCGFCRREKRVLSGLLCGASGQTSSVAE